MQRQTAFMRSSCWRRFAFSSARSGGGGHGVGRWRFVRRGGGGASSSDEITITSSCANAAGRSVDGGIARVLAAVGGKKKTGAVPGPETWGTTHARAATIRVFGGLVPDVHTMRRTLARFMNGLTTNDRALVSVWIYA
jgi:hypothetical protein